jgi:ABC-type transport system involved in multi-copper enzyme maturation permease subunit
MSVALHLGPGPVFKFECLTASRRWQHFAGRVVCIGLLLAALTWVARDVASRSSGPVGLRELASAGEKFYLAITITQLSLLLLIAPAVAADSFCLDKARGSLLTLLTTDLSSREIVLGKLLARLLPIVGYVCCSLPVLAICFSLGGIQPDAAFGSFLVCLGIALVGGTLALALSVWCSKTYEVLLASYVMSIGYLLLLPIVRSLPSGKLLGFLQSNRLIDWIEDANPIYLSLRPYLSPGSVGPAQFIYFFLGCLGISLLLVLCAIFSLRPAIQRHGSSVSKKQRHGRLSWLPKLGLLPRPSLDGNPVLWREWQRRQPSRWVRVVWFLYFGAGMLFSGYAFLMSLRGPAWNPGEIQPFVSAFLVSIGLLMVSISSVTSLQEERSRGSLDVLLATPLSSSQIYWGKWWGSFRMVLLLAILPTGVAMAPFIGGLLPGRRTSVGPPGSPLLFLLMPLVVACYGGATISLGLALAIWIKRGARAMGAAVVCYLMATVGLLLTPLLSHSESYSCLGSSFMAGGYITVQAERDNAFNGNFVPAIIAWCLAYLLAACLFAFLGYRAFDRCLGRLPEGMSRCREPIASPLQCGLRRNPR